MDTSCNLYLLLILLMRSGDIETNPGPNSQESTVSELELFRLAKSITWHHYIELGIYLGVPYNDLEAIRESSTGDTDAFMTMFIRWRDQQAPETNFRDILAQKLNQAALYDLAWYVLNGSLTGDPSRPIQRLVRPLSPELVERCKSEFKFKYRTTVCKIRADPLNPDSLVQFEDMFVHLALEEEVGESRRPLEYKDLFELRVNGEFPRRLFVQGDAGIGKTTLCAKIAWDWVNERYGLGQYEWALLVHFRDAKWYSIGEIAKSYLSKTNPTTVDQITDYMRCNPGKVFIAFDGLDEFRGQLIKYTKNNPQSQSSDQSQLSSSSPKDASLQPEGNSSTVCANQRGDIDVVDIIHSVQLEACPVLVTCRPWRAGEIRSDEDLKKLYTFINVKGFNEEYLLQYFYKYFLDDDITIDHLLALIKENPVITEHMIQNPFHVSLLCLLWKSLTDADLQRLSCVQTSSQLVGKKIRFLKEHYAQKHVRSIASPRLIASLQENNKLLQPISEIALAGLLENKRAFSEDDFMKCPDSLEIALKTGVMSKENRPDGTVGHQGMKATFFFPEKLFQEYMAANHLSSLNDSDQKEFNRLMEQVVLPQKDHFKYLLYFTVWHSEDIAVFLVKHLMQCGGYGVRTAIMDVLFESQREEAVFSLRDILSSRNMEVNVNSTMTAHTLSGYAYTLLDVGKLSVERDCGPAMTRSIAVILCSSSYLKEAYLGLHSSFFQNWLFKLLAENGKNSQVQALSLQGVTIPSPASSQDLAKALCSMPALTHLTLDRLNLHDKFYTALKALASFMQVQSLCLRGINCIAPGPSHDFAIALCSIPNLSDLTFIDVGLGEEFYSTFNAIATYLKGFPQFSNGEFRFNGFTQQTLDSFLQSLAEYKRVQSRKRSMLTTLHRRQLTGHMRSPDQLPILRWNRTGDGYHGIPHSSENAASSSSSSSSGQPRAMHEAAMASSRSFSRGYPDIDVYEDFLRRSSGRHRRDPRGFPDILSGRHALHRRLSYSWYDSFLASQEGQHRGARRRMDRYHGSMPWDPHFMASYLPSMEDFDMPSHSWGADWRHRPRSSRRSKAPIRYPYLDEESDSD